MKIVVTGSNGRIGRNVVKVALNAGHTVQGIDSVEAPERLDFYSDSNFSFDKADLRDYEQALRLLQGAQAVIHLAGIPQPFDYAVNTHNTYVNR